MFKINLVNIAGDGLVASFNSTLDTLAEVEILIKAVINAQLGIHCIELVYDEDLTYSVWVNGRKIGVVVIMDVNSKPRIKKER